MRQKRTSAGGRSLARVGTALVVAFAALVGGSHVASALTICSGPDCYIAPEEDNYTTTYGAKLTVGAAEGLLANDTGPAGTTVMVDDSDSQSWNGADVALKSNGSFTYTPDPTVPFSGIDEFDYAIHKGDDEEFATVYIQVEPIMNDDASYTHVNQVLVVPTPGIYANDAGLDDSFAPDYDGSSAHGGAVTVNDDGSFQYVPPGGFSGVDTFTYTQWDLNFDLQYTGLVSVYVDSTRPTVAVDPLPAVALEPKVHVDWSGSDTISGVAGYDVNQTVAAWNGDYGAATAVGRALTSTGLDRFGTYGRTYCYTARAHDNAENISAWTSKRCTSIPLKATQFTYSSGWTSASNDAFFGGVARKTSTFGAKATRTAIKAKQVWLVVSKCSTCGVVTVRWNGVVKANVNTYSATPQHEVVVPVLTLSTPQSGTLTATLASRGKSAIIEGLAVYRG